MLFIPACNTPATEQKLNDIQRDNDSLCRELSEKNEAMFRLRDSIRMARLRDSAIREWQ